MIQEPGEALRWLAVSGQGPMDPATGKKYLGPDAEKRARLALEGLRRVTIGSGYELENTIEVIVYIAKDIDLLTAFNEAYVEVFPDEEKRPARSSLAVSHEAD